MAEIVELTDENWKKITIAPAHEYAWINKEGWVVARYRPIELVRVGIIWEPPADVLRMPYAATILPEGASITAWADSVIEGYDKWRTYRYK